MFYFSRIKQHFWFSCYNKSTLIFIILKIYTNSKRYLAFNSKTSRKIMFIHYSSEDCSKLKTINYILRSESLLSENFFALITIKFRVKWTLFVKEFKRQIRLNRNRSKAKLRKNRNAEICLTIIYSIMNHYLYKPLLPLSWFL